MPPGLRGARENTDTNEVGSVDTFMAGLTNCFHFHWRFPPRASSRVRSWLTCEVRDP